MDTAERVNGLREISGRKVQSVLDTLDESQQRIFNAQDVLDYLKNDWSDIAKEEAFKDMRAPMEAIMTSIEQRGDKAISFKEAQALKNVFKRGFKMSREEGTKGDLTRQAYFAIRDKLDDAVEKAALNIDDPKLAKEFLQAKADYHSARVAEQAMDDMISSVSGNKLFGLTDAIFAANFASAGGAPVAITTGIAKKILERRGPAAAAQGLNSLAKVAPNMGKYSKVLLDSMARGTNSAASTHYVLMQKDPDYRKKYEEAQKSNNEGE